MNQPPANYGQPHQGLPYPPQGHAPPGWYGGPPFAPVGGGPGSFQRAANAAGPAIALAGIMAGLHVVGFGLGRVLRSETFWNIWDGLENLVQLVALIFFWIWSYRVTAAIRATQGTSAYSPAMSVVAWFIPLANFVMPVLALRDIWKRTMGADGRGIVVVLFWIGWIFATVMRVIYALEEREVLFPSLLCDRPGMTNCTERWVFDTLSLLSWPMLAAQIGLWVCLLLTMRWITQRTRT